MDYNVSMTRKLVDEQFFNEWSPAMAYVLGLFASDGTMTVNPRGSRYIDFALTDHELILHVRSALRAKQKVATRSAKNERSKVNYRIQIGSKRLYDQLLRLGFTPNKSKTLALPSIPKTYFPHFVRGYFDGDGNVYFRQHFAKDRQASRWVFSSRFTCGSESFLEALHINLLALGLRGGRIARKKAGFELVFSHNDSFALYRIMYHNAGRMFLRRKRTIFKKAFREFNMRV